MKALYFDGELKLRSDVAPPRPGEGEALVRVLRAGICDTDLEIMKGYMGFRGVPGHEFVGQVEAAQDRSLVNQIVVGEINCACGRCSSCEAGQGNHCPNRTVLGIDGRNGAFAEYLALPEKNLHPVPSNVTIDEAVFVEPLAAACRVTEQVRINSGSSVCVFGDGKLGLLAAQVVRLKTARVTLVGKHAPKMRLLGGLGIRCIELKSFTAQPFDVTVECTGSPEGFALALSCTRPLGTLVLKTTTQAPAAGRLAPAVVNEVTIVGSRCGPFKEAISLLRRKKVRVEGMITARFRLEDAALAFEAAAKTSAIKVLLDVDQPPIGASTGRQARTGK
jgi:threonine dehydrogenase-like Zn-dependent dehydrogenase